MGRKCNALRPICSYTRSIQVLYNIQTESNVVLYQITPGREFEVNPIQFYATLCPGFVQYLETFQNIMHEGLRRLQSNLTWLTLSSSSYCPSANHFPLSLLLLTSFLPCLSLLFVTRASSLTQFSLNDHTARPSLNIAVSSSIVLLK